MTQKLVDTAEVFILLDTDKSELHDIIFNKMFSPNSVVDLTLNVSEWCSVNNDQLVTVFNETDVSHETLQVFDSITLKDIAIIKTEITALDFKNDPTPKELNKVILSQIGYREVELGYNLIDLDLFIKVKISADIETSRQTINDISYIG